MRWEPIYESRKRCLLDSFTSLRQPAGSVGGCAELQNPGFLETSTEEVCLSTVLIPRICLVGETQGGSVMLSCLAL